MKYGYKVLKLFYCACELNVHVSPHFVCWSPPHNVVVFGSGGFGKWRHSDELMRMGLVPLKEDKDLSLSLPPPLFPVPLCKRTRAHRAIAMWEHSGKVAGHQPEEGSHHAGTLTSDFQPPNCEEISVCALNCQSVFCCRQRCAALAGLRYFGQFLFL